VVTEVELVPEVRRQYVPLPPGLAEPVDVPQLPRDGMTNRQLADLASEAHAALLLANSRLARIAELQPDDATD
jgi:hypothetical protein